MLRILVMVCLAFAALVRPGAAQEVLVSPGSIVLDDRDRGATLTVGNTGNTISLYELQPAFFRMGPDGMLTEVAPPFPANSAEEVVRFSPRQFELAPGQNQIVRIAARIPPGLPPGEYRIHLRVTNLGGALPAPQLSTPAGNAVQLNIRIQVARAVRVLVRHGVDAGRASLANVTSRPAAGGVLVSFDLDRGGPGSSSGAYRIYTRSRSGAKGSDLTSGRVLIYSELPGRQVEQVIAAKSIGPGVDLCVAYRDDRAGDGGEEERCIRLG